MNVCENYVKFVRLRYEWGWRGRAGKLWVCLIQFCLLFRIHIDDWPHTDQNNMLANIQKLMSPFNAVNSLFLYWGAKNAAYCVEKHALFQICCKLLQEWTCFVFASLFFFLLLFLLWQKYKLNLEICRWW